MKLEEAKISVAGYQLHQLRLIPETSPKKTLIFFHGQGDHIDRYPEILSPFVEAGVQCLLTDLPGHGRSPGRRGYVPSLKLVDQLFEKSISQAAGNLLLAGHSMGGLLALRFLLAHPSKFEAAWFSSPLLDPMHQAKPWMRTILPLIAPAFPWITVSTGVKGSDCRDDDTPSKNDVQPLYHDRISLAWGLTLAKISQAVRDGFFNLPDACQILFTQGAEDQVCPAHILQRQLEKVSLENVTYEEIPEARHEPFVGSASDDFRARLSRWISDVLS